MIRDAKEYENQILVGGAGRGGRVDCRIETG